MTDNDSPGIHIRNRKNIAQMILVECDSLGK